MLHEVHPTLATTPNRAASRVRWPLNRPPRKYGDKLLSAQYTRSVIMPPTSPIAKPPWSGLPASA